MAADVPPCQADGSLTFADVQRWAATEHARIERTKRILLEAARPGRYWAEVARDPKRHQLIIGV